MSVTIHDLARLSGVDASTVSRALHDDSRISQKTKERIRALAEQQGYVMNMAARTLAAGKTQMVALIMNSIVNPIQAIPANAINEVLAERGYTLMILLHNHTADSLEHCLEKLEQKICDAAIMSPPTDDCFTPELTRRIRQLNMPFCFMDCWQENAGKPAITTDVETSIHMLMDHVMKEQPEGAFVCPCSHNTVSRARHQCVLEHLAEQGLPWISQAEDLPAFITGKNIQRLAVFADSPWMAETLPLHFPKDSTPACIGAMFDPWENTPPHFFSKIFLCIQDFPAIGHQCAEMILDLLEGKAIPPSVFPVAPSKIIEI